MPFPQQILLVFCRKEEHPIGAIPENRRHRAIVYTRQAGRVVGAWWCRFPLSPGPGEVVERVLAGDTALFEILRMSSRGSWGSRRRREWRRRRGEASAWRLRLI
jgi:hypothetical protein